MRPETKKFIEAFFANVTIDGITRRVQVIEEYDGTTTVKLVAPPQCKMPTVFLGFPENWKPPQES